MSHHNRPVAEDPIQIAEEKKVDEIIIGLSKRSQIGKLLFGSTARQILLVAPCPVLTVRHPEHDFISDEDDANT